MKLKNNIANIITAGRIAFSAALLFFSVTSPVFIILYLLAGISDMTDGTVARKTGSVSDFGSKLDTAADFVMFIVCLIKIIPVIKVPVWIYIWAGIIGIIKIISTVSGYAIQKKFIALHTVMNRITGVLLFIFPLTVTFVKPVYTLPVICAAASAAAIQEGYLTIKSKQTKPIV